MAASKKTIEGVLAVLRKRLDWDSTINVIQDLQKVPGNASFKQTMRSLLIGVCQAGTQEAAPNHLRTYCEAVLQSMLGH